MVSFICTCSQTLLVKIIILSIEKYPTMGSIGKEKTNKMIYPTMG
jgi:hypothetical protein